MKRAVVIGAGFGGLALAIRLQSAGVETTIVEARDKPGGRAYVFEDQGFKFDAGPTVITDPTCLEELFELSGRKLSDYVELLPVTPFYRLLWEDGTVFDSSYERGAPAAMPLDRLIPAWQEALQLMRPGDEWTLYVPSNLGYGEEGAGQIPPGAPLIFRIELIDVLPAPGRIQQG